MDTENSKNSKIEELPVPACIIDREGIIIDANSMIGSVFPYEGIIDGNFFALTGVKLQELTDTSDENDENDEKEIKIKRNEKYFLLKTNLNIKNSEYITVLFINITQREIASTAYKEEKTCLLLISIDNYDELISSAGTDSRMFVTTEVDSTIRKWAEEYRASIQSIKEDTYIMYVYRRDADKIIESKFSILDKVRNIETKIDFPLSLSIGMGLSAKTPSDTEELAEASLELAMGRGGDQAVVKNSNRTHYYGGKSQSVEKNNKGKSRIIAHALKQLILDSSKVFIMGHQWPDMDCFGASLGTYKICENFGKDTYIVIEEYNEALQVIYNQAKESGNYSIINNEKAISLCDEKSLVIIVDTHRPMLMECPDLLEMVEKVVVIDHHRLAEDAIENPTLSYIESYASSASELITEIIQYSSNKKIIRKFEAEALLAGITVDTNSYSMKTGVRTFEAAAWLRKAGADTTEVKRFFQTEATSFQAKAEAVANAEYLDNGIALSVSEGYSTEAQIINSQVADELLMVKGVKAVFAMGRNDKNKTVISARSLGDINVQMIMEKFNGGGHLSAAGAQVDMSPLEVLKELKEILPKYVENKKEEE